MSNRSGNKYYGKNYNKCGISGNSKIKGCGGLIVSEYGGKTYLLMGKDYKGALCDFGGKRESDESCLKCATREFYEETSGTVLSETDVHTRFNSCKETICFNTYLCYVIRIEYDPSIPKRYRDYKNYVMTNGIKYPAGHFELNDMIWVEINDLYYIHFTKKLIHNRTRYILKKFFMKNDKLLDKNRGEADKNVRSQISVSAYQSSQSINIKTYTPVIRPSSSPINFPTISL